MRPTLAEIILRQGLATDKNSRHSYCDHYYESAFAPYRDRRLQIVEIGVDRGSSLVLWAEYFRYASIFGADIALRGDCVKDCGHYPGIQLWVGNSYSPEGLERVPPADIVIDDGPHTLETQLWAVANLLPKVRPGGLFVVEDVADVAHLDQLAAATPVPLRPHVEFVDLRSVKGRHDDILFVVRVPGGEDREPAAS